MTAAELKNMKAKSIDQDVCDAINSGSWDELNFTMPPLDSKLYQKVKKVMESVGGKWNRSAKAIIFKDEDAKSSLIEAGATGTYVDLKRAFQQFDTPDDLAIDLIGQLDVVPEPGRPVKFLEPSGGTGNLIKMINSMCAGANIDCTITTVELDPQRLDTLAAMCGDSTNQLSRVRAGDFLEFKPGDLGLFDYIVMNPPFTNGQDIDHVMHAWSLLEPEGQLVAIMSPSWLFNSSRKHSEFRDFLAAHDASHGEFPEGSFKVSGTNIRTTWVLLTKPK